MDWLEANGAVLRYDITGSGPETLLLIHELGGALESWDETLPALSKSFRVVRYDQRGAGLSEKARTLSLDQVVGDAVSLLDGLDISEPVRVVGTALGGGFAIALAATHPKRVSRLVATSPATGVSGPRGQSLLDRAAAVETDGMRVAVEQSLSASYPAGLREGAANLARFERYQKRWLSNDPGSFAALNRMLAETDMQWAFAKVACPTLIIGGTADPIRPPAAVEKLAKMISDAEYRETPAGHFMAVQQPELFLAETLPFLQG